jgi:hypothetical protein
MGTQSIGAIMANMAEPHTEKKTDLCSLLTGDLALMAWEWVSKLPLRLSDVELREVGRLAEMQPPPLQPCSPKHFVACMKAMSILAKRADDEIDGEYRVKVYERILGRYPDEAISLIAEKAISTCVFFPSVAECFGFLKSWERADPAHLAIEKAKVLTIREGEARLNDTRMKAKDGLLTQADVDVLSNRAREILYNECLLRRLPDGSYAPRTRPAPQAQAAPVPEMAMAA